jgi:hypothetical protein
VASLTVENCHALCMGEFHPVAVTRRISDKFQVRSDGGTIRVIVCIEEQTEGVSSSAYKYQSRRGFKTYQFEGGEPAAKIGDAYLDRTGQIYRRITSDSQQDTSDLYCAIAAPTLPRCAACSVSFATRSLNKSAKDRLRHALFDALKALSA